MRKIFKRRTLTIILSSVAALSLCCCNPTYHEDDPIIDDGSIKSIVLDKTSLEMNVGETETLSVTISPENAINNTLIWSSSNESVATVTSSGLITAIAKGTSIITVKSETGNKEASCTLTVKEGTISVKGISLNYDKASVKIGKTITLVATIDPYNATNKGISWSTSESDVASVINGVVTGVSVGSATITATSNDGNYKATCLVSVAQDDEDGDEYDPGEPSEDILQITEAGDYTLEKNYKQIYVNAPEAAVNIDLNGHTIENNQNSPIYVADCDSVDISASKGTTNYIKDTRSIYKEDDDTQGKGAIYVANGDLKLKGTGILNVSAGYNHGIFGKDDVKVQKLTLNVTAPNNGIRGNDSVTISSGTINISCGGDGIHTENSDISTKLKQRGDVTINGGNLTINSWGDAVTAAHDALFEETDASTPIVYTTKTNKYSSYSGETIDISTAKLYLKMNSSTYSNGNYTYAAYINNVWYPATFKESQSSGTGRPGQSTYYFYELEKPKDATSFKLYRFQGKNVTTYSTTSYNAVSDAKAFNDAYDTVQISVSNKKINFSNWSNYSSSGSGISSKGIKAENEIYIKSGTYNFETYDDAIHANNDGSLGNGQTPLGNVNISGGNITINSADDGIHGDSALNISGGRINITKSYEGLEGNVITISGGEIFVTATDDGVNAGKGNASPQIIINDGYLDVTVSSSGDTDGIDSNGTYTQNGGVVITKGPGTASGRTMGAASLDTDSTVRVNGGTLIVFGGIEQTPVSSLTRTLVSSTTVATGQRTISFTSTSYTTTLTTSTNGCVVYSVLGTATLK